MAESLTLKVEFEDDLRRLRVKIGEQDSPADQIKGIHQAIISGFSLDSHQPTLLLKYKDDEGDLCTLVEATIEDFLSQGGGKALRLVASRSSPLTSSPPAPEEQVKVNPAKAEPATAPLQPAVSSTCAPSATPPWATANAGCEGAHSMGPWKLLMCLRTLRDADMMSCKMVSSMMLQFLNILSQRAHRKQEKLNKLGPQKREALLPLLHSVAAHLDLVEEAKSLRPLLEDFVSGKDVNKLGDFLAALFRAMATAKDRQAVADAITGVAPDLLDSLSQLFPGLFGPNAESLGMLPPEHAGVRCSACSCQPIKGPRFHSAEASVDLCGECFIVQGCELSDKKFECFFMPESSNKQAWGDIWKDKWAEKIERWRAKGKGKGKGWKGGKWQWWLGEEPTEKQEDAASCKTEESKTVDGAPPGLEQQPWGETWWHDQWLAKLKKGKGKCKGKWDGWPAMCGPWWNDPALLGYAAFPAQMWPWGLDAGSGATDASWTSQEACGQGTLEGDAN